MQCDIEAAMERLPHRMKQVVCIAGPTASGKSAWAVELAHMIDGEIINADSMQVYADLRILTARPSVDEMENIPHHLFGHVDGQTQYSVGQWVKDVIPVILDCMAREKTPILVGGTGLYFKALIDGLTEVPTIDEAVTLSTRNLMAQGMDKLRKRANELDPIATAKVLGNDGQRLQRIVNVAVSTGKSLSDWRKNTRPFVPSGFWQGAILLPDRETLYERINNRYESMVANGGLEEVRKFKKLQLLETLTLSKAVGVPPLMDYLDGKISYEDALSQAKRDTRRFAKRQFTWFRGQAKHWFSVKNSEDRAKFRHKISQISV